MGDRQKQELVELRDRHVADSLTFVDPSDSVGVRGGIHSGCSPAALLDLEKVSLADCNQVLGLRTACSSPNLVLLLCRPCAALIAASLLARHSGQDPQTGPRLEAANKNVTTSGFGSPGLQPQGCVFKVTDRRVWLSGKCSVQTGKEAHDQGFQKQVKAYVYTNLEVHTYRPFLKLARNTLGTGFSCFCDFYTQRTLPVPAKCRESEA